MPSRLTGSRPVVGSSRKMMPGRWTRAAARSRRRFMPPEYVPIVRSAASSRSTMASRSSTRWRRSPPRMPKRRAWRVSSSRPVWISSRPASWRATPMRFRTARASARMSSPATRALPAVGRSRVVSMRMVVVLPEPFCPRKPKMVPAAMSRSMPSTARTSSKCLVRPWAQMALIVSSVEDPVCWANFPR